MTGYTRQSTYSDGNTILAADSNDEFDALQIAMAAGTGHAHDNNAGQGAYVPLISNVANTKKVAVTASGALTTGDHQVTGQIISDAGPITATLGNIVAAAGSIDATVGAVTAGTTITAGTGITVTTGNLTMTAAGATVDGRDLTVDGAKLDLIEASATADQTDAEIKTAYENNADTNEFSDSEQTKLAGIETAATADQLASEVTSTAAGNIASTDVQAALQEIDAFIPRRNIIIGGDFHTNPWQRGTSFTSVANAAYTSDRFTYERIGAMVHDISKASDAPTVAQAGIYTENSLLIDCTTADTSIAAGDISDISQNIEGYDWSRIAQRQFTISFWHKHTKTGTYCVAFRNSAGDRSYVSEYTQASSDTWEKSTVTVAASPTAGTWDYTNGIGLRVSFSLAAGTNFHTTADAWNTGNFLATSNQVNACDSVSNNFKLALIQVEEGTVATDFERRSFAEELSLSQRYGKVLSGEVILPPASEGVTAFNSGIEQFPVTMRAAPTVTTTSFSFVGHHASAPAITTNVDQIRYSYTGADERSGGGRLLVTGGFADAEL